MYRGFTIELRGLKLGYVHSLGHCLNLQDFEIRSLSARFETTRYFDRLGVAISTWYTKDHVQPDISLFSKKNMWFRQLGPELTKSDSLCSFRSKQDQNNAQFMAQSTYIKSTTVYVPSSELGFSPPGTGDPNSDDWRKA